MRRPSFRRPAIELVLVQVLFALYGGWFIARTSFIVQGDRYFALNDTAMIAMQHARNLASGHGWADWNAGRDSVLWTLWMAAIHSLPLARSTISVAMQITSLVVLLANLGFVHAIARQLGASRWTAAGALLLTAGFYPLDSAALQGSEVGLLAVWTSCSVWLALRSVRRSRDTSKFYIVLGVGPLVRLDAAIAAVVLAVTASVARRRGTAPRSLALVAPAVIVSLSTISVHVDLGRWPSPNRGRPAGVVENRRHVSIARRLESITAAGAAVAADSIGCLGYFAARACIELDSIVSREPDVVVASLERMHATGAMARYHGHDLQGLGKVFLRRDSNAILLDSSERLASQWWWDGVALQNQGRIGEALELFERAIATGPANDTWPYHFGALLVERRSLAEVEAYYDRIAPQDRKPHISEYCRGVALGRAGRFDEAVERFQRALAIDPAHELSYEMLGNMAAARGRFEEANEFFRTAIEIVPEYASAHRNLAASLQRLGRSEEAELHLRRAAAGDASPAQRCYDWGRYLLDHGHAKLAIAPLECALASDPDHAGARRLLQRARLDAAATGPAP